MSEPQGTPPQAGAERGGIGAQTAQGAPPAPTGALTDDEKLWGMLAHLLTLLAYVGIPFGNLVGPAIAYFTQKDKSKFVRFHAIQSFAFQLLLFVAGMVLAIPFFILAVLSFGLILLVLIPLGLALLAYIIYMGIQANKGEYCRYVLVGDWVYNKVYSEDWKPL